MKLFKAIRLLVRNAVVPAEQRVPVTQKQSFDALQKDIRDITKMYDDMK